MLIDHLHLRVRDLEASRRFYAALCEALGVEMEHSAAHFAAKELWVDKGELPSRVHFAFGASDKASVDRWYIAGLAAGGRDNGAPGPRSYHPGYYAAFLLDPDGNNVEAVYHGETGSQDII